MECNLSENFDLMWMNRYGNIWMSEVKNACDGM